MFIEDEQSFSENGSSERVALRTRVLINAVLVTAEERISVRVRDFSQTGAHVSSEVRLVPDTDLLFCKGHASVAAKVAWVRCKSAGLTFHRALSVGEIDDIFAACRSRQAVPLGEEADIVEERAQ